MGSTAGGGTARRSAVALIAAAGLGVTTVAGCTTGPAEPLKGAGEPTSPSITAPSASPGPGPGSRRPGEDRPNFLVITADDASPDDLAHMPNVQRLLADEGVTLTDMVAPTPICVPARASLLTGQYAHNHGALTIDGEGGSFEAFDDRGTLPVWLRRVGYDTLFVGKYLNGYGAGTGGPTYVPPGWSDWRGSVDYTTYYFAGTRINVNGEVAAGPGYNTDVFADHVTEMLSAPERQANPWFLNVNYVAPHTGQPIESDDPIDFATTVPAQRHRDAFKDLPLPDKPNMFERRPGDKVMRGTHDRARWDAEERAAMREAHQQRIESLQAVDEAVREHVWVLRETGQLDRTVVVFTSDNGYAVGEHNLTGKLWHYRDSQTVPMVVRGPGIPKGRTVPTLTANVDIPTTVAAWARATPTRVVDGIDLRPVLRGRARRSLAERAVPTLAHEVHATSRRPIYRGLRLGSRWNYAKLRRGEELFDRRTDPYELRNVARDPAYRPVLRRVRALTRALRDCAGATCRREPRS